MIQEFPPPIPLLQDQTSPSPNGAKLDSVIIPDILTSLAEPGPEELSAIGHGTNKDPIHSLTASTISSATAAGDRREHRALSTSNGNISSAVADKTRSRVNSRELAASKRPSAELAAPRESATVLQLGEDYARFLVLYTSAILDGVGKAETGSDTAAKPKLESRAFKPHTMDNIRVRRMCEVCGSAQRRAPLPQTPLVHPVPCPPRFPAMSSIRLQLPATRRTRCAASPSYLTNPPVSYRRTCIPPLPNTAPPRAQDRAATGGSRQ